MGCDFLEENVFSQCSLGITVSLVSGSGDVFYSGNPVLDVEISGSGTVKKI